MPSTAKETATVDLMEAEALHTAAFATIDALDHEVFSVARDIPGDRAMKDDPVTAARARWHEASTQASKIAAELFQPGSGYGDGDGYGYGQERRADEHRLQTAREESERLFQEYRDLDRRDLDAKMLALQRSQRLATWASFAVAAVVGLATVVSTVVAFLK